MEGEGIITCSPSLADATKWTKNFTLVLFEDLLKLHMKLESHVLMYVLTPPRLGSMNFTSKTGLSAIQL